MTDFNKFTLANIKAIFKRINIFSNRPEDCDMHDSKAQRILDWFLQQNILPRTEKTLKFVIFQVYLENLDLNTVLSLDFWDEFLIEDCDGWYERIGSQPI